jgi:DNA-directed RNA polymerase specialized sigma24 family protein
MFLIELLAKRWLKEANPHLGRFRSFLFTLLQNFLRNYRRTQAAQKRGGGSTVFSLDGAEAEQLIASLAAEQLDPAKAFDRVWAIHTFDRALRRLDEECRTAGLGAQIENFGRYLKDWPAKGEYERIGATLGLTPAQVAKRVLDLRRRFREVATPRSRPGSRNIPR